MKNNPLFKRRTIDRYRVRDTLHAFTLVRVGRRRPYDDGTHRFRTSQSDVQGEGRGTTGYPDQPVSSHFDEFEFR